MKAQQLLYKIVFIALCLWLTAICAAAQDDEPASRSINSLDFQSQRPATSKAKKGVSAGFNPKAPVSNQKRRKSIAVVTNPGRRYKWVKRVAAKTKNPQTVKLNSKTKPQPLRNEEIGVTFWRLRPLKSDERDDAPTFAVNTGDGVEDWTAERVRSTTKFKIGDRVRFTIESSRSGFLYIVNREIYADGATGDAELIYPTLKSGVKGDNRVVAGSLIDIPHSGEAVPYFRIKPKRDDYAGEEVLVIISPVKLPGIKLGLKALPVSREKVDKWLADWSASADIYDATDGEGVAYTRTEAEAVNTRALTQEEPLPQTIYRVQARTNQALLVLVQMQTKAP